jgi:hypothetical protein
MGLLELQLFNAALIVVLLRSCILPSYPSKCWLIALSRRKDKRVVAGTTRFSLRRLEAVFA